MKHNIDEAKEVSLQYLKKAFNIKEENIIRFKPTHKN